MNDELDGTDRELISLLQENARRSFGDMAPRVSLSPAAVKRRLDRLERLGVVVGYSAIVDDAKMGAPIEAFTEIRIAGTTDVEDVVAAAVTLPEVRGVYTTAGDPDFMIWLRVADSDRLLQIVNHFRRTTRIVSTKTHIVLKSWTPADGERLSLGPATGGAKRNRHS